MTIDSGDRPIQVCFRPRGRRGVEASIRCGDDDSLILWAAEDTIEMTRELKWRSHPGDPDFDGGKYMRALLDGRSDVRWRIGWRGIPGTEFSGPDGMTLANVIVAAVSAGGAGTVLMATLGKLFTRHQDKTVEFDVDGRLKVVRGYSAKDVDRVVKALELGERNLKKRDLWKALEELLTEDTLPAKETPEPNDD